MRHGVLRHSLHCILLGAGLSPAGKSPPFDRVTAQPHLALCFEHEQQQPEMAQMFRILKVYLPPL
jgi:hypothetical protein